MTIAATGIADSGAFSAGGAPPDIGVAVRGADGNGKATAGINRFARLLTSPRSGTGEAGAGPATVRPAFAASAAAEPDSGGAPGRRAAGLAQPGFLITAALPALAPPSPPSLAAGDTPPSSLLAAADAPPSLLAAGDAPPPPAVAQAGLISISFPGTVAIAVAGGQSAASSLRVAARAFATADVALAAEVPAGAALPNAPQSPDKGTVPPTSRVAGEAAVAPPAAVACAGVALHAGAGLSAGDDGTPLDTPAATPAPGRRADRQRAAPPRDTAPAAAASLALAPPFGPPLAIDAGPPAQNAASSAAITGAGAVPGPAVPPAAGEIAVASVPAAGVAADAGRGAAASPGFPAAPDGAGPAAPAASQPGDTQARVAATDQRSVPTPGVAPRGLAAVRRAAPEHAADPATELNRAIAAPPPVTAPPADAGSPVLPSLGGAAPVAVAGASTAQAAPAPAAPLPPVVALPFQPATLARDVGLTIARRIGRDGDELRIRLEPATFGTIDVRLSFDDRGSLRALVGADSALALDLLRRDAAELGRALADAGVRADDRSFRFESRGDGQPGSQADARGRFDDGQRGDGQPQHRTPWRVSPPFASTADVAASSIHTRRGGVDVIA